MPLPNKMHQEIASAINRVLFHQNVIAEMTLRHRKSFITPGRTTKKEILDVDKNKTWVRLLLRIIPRVRDMGNGNHGLQKMR